MNILMVSKSHYREDIRVRKEAESLIQAGHMVTVVSTDDGRFNEHGVEVLGLGESRGMGPKRHQPTGFFYRAARWMLLPEHRHRALIGFQQAVLEAVAQLAQKYDVVHAHDFPALEPASLIAHNHRARLVYDAHEFWTGMVRHGRPEPRRRRRYRGQEAKLVQEADAVITVSESAARLLSRTYGIDKVEVVRNTFPTSDQLHPPAQPIGAVYAGRIGPGRDLENVFASRFWESTGLNLHLMGPRETRFPIPDGVYVHASGSMEEVNQLLVTNGIALVPLARGPLNHDIALPNKLFQAVAVGVPVVTANLPQLQALVAERSLGTSYTPGDPTSLINALTQVQDNYERFRTNTVAARADLTWTVDAARLTQIYEALEPGRRR